MKKIAVHVNDEKLFDSKWIEYIELYGEYEVVPVNMKSVNAIEDVRDCDGIMWHYLHSPLDKQVAPKILTALEQGLNKKVWPNQNTRWFFDEKVSQHYFLQSIGVKCIPSWVFWSYEQAEEFLDNTKEYPLVFKLSVGAGAANVIKINNYSEAIFWLKKSFNEGIYPYTLNNNKDYYPSIKDRLKQSIEYLMKRGRTQVPWYYQIQKDYFYIQKFIPHNKYDIRITIIGNRAFGFIRNNRDEDFRASGSGKIDWNPNIIPIDAIKTAFYISKTYKFQSMAYDFMINERGESVINEMSYGYDSTAVYNCPGHWDENLNWYEGNMWPEEAHIQDFIRQIEEEDRCAV